MKRKPCTHCKHLPCSYQAWCHVVCTVKTLWRCPTWRAITILAVFLAVAFFLAGCNHAPAPARPPVAFAPVVASQEGKDATVLAEAAKIDAIAPAAKPHTDAQRAAVAAAPAEDVKKLADAYEAQASDNSRLVAKLTKERDEARNATDRTIILGGYAVAALLTASGVATFFLMAQLAFLGPKIGYALIASGASVFAMLQAYQWTKAHPWITGIALLFLVAAGALAFANHAHSKDA